jgi:uncharacterized protein YqjF (DUF2071 family)
MFGRGRRGCAGFIFFSLDAASALAVLGARTLFHLPYFWAQMERRVERDGTIGYSSRRLLTRGKVRFEARYRGLGAVGVPSGGVPSGGVQRGGVPSGDGALEHFLTERYCLFTRHGGSVLVGHIHHLPWPLEAAEAEISVNEVPAAHGLVLPDRSPVLHFARELEVYIWTLREDR